MAINGNQWQSMAINGNQWPSRLDGIRRVDGPERAVVEIDSHVTPFMEVERVAGTTG